VQEIQDQLRVLGVRQRRHGGPGIAMVQGRHRVEQLDTPKNLAFPGPI
jgi:hypothetical protein